VECPVVLTPRSSITGCRGSRRAEHAARVRHDRLDSHDQARRHLRRGLGPARRLPAVRRASLFYFFGYQTSTARSRGTAAQSKATPCCTRAATAPRDALAGVPQARRRVGAGAGWTQSLGTRMPGSPTASAPCHDPGQPHRLLPRGPPRLRRHARGHPRRQHHVHLQTFIFEPDATGDEFLDA